VVANVNADRDRHPVDLGIHLWAQNTSWHEIRTAALRAEAAGYRYVWTWDHLYAIFGDPAQPAFEGWTLLAALAEATQRVQIGILVTANPLRNPGVVAKMAATVDAISGGRLVLGMGAAWNRLEHDAHGIAFGGTPGERLRWLEESLVAIRALLAGVVYTSPGGSHYSFRNARHAPGPVQGRLPILVGGGGERRTLRLVAEHADLWNIMGSADEVALKAGVLDQHCAAVGRDAGEILRTVTVRVLIRDREVEARQEWSRLMAGLGSSESDLPAFTGSPALIADCLQPYVDAGFDAIIIELPAPYDAETVDRLPSDVVPLLRQGS
jgi:alkanesulfonate monooxygenase SsuD/methylene tetrahydromethanopterin reductase-like flavin-dependent oxidoreductase (luciferase family)